MKSKFFAILLLLPFLGMTQNKYVGMWKNLDDEDGKEKSHISVYCVGNELKAMVVKLLQGAKLRKCEACKGTMKNKSIEGMDIITGMKKQSDGTYGDGFIINPKNGKSYKCTISLDDDNTLRVRGYVGISAFGKTQFWYRLP